MKQLNRNGIRNNVNNGYSTRNHPFIETKKLIILTNSQTASAAEAACIILSKHPNSIIIGTNTQGKSEIKTSPSKIVKHTHFYIPNHHISPDIFKRFDSKLDNESVYLESIKLSNQFQKEYDSTIKPRLTSGN